MRREHLTTYIASSPKMVMTYVHPDTGKKHAHVVDPTDKEASRLVVRTIRWASHYRVEVNFRPA